MTMPAIQNEDGIGQLVEVVGQIDSVEEFRSEDAVDGGNDEMGRINNYLRKKVNGITKHLNFI